MSFLRKQESSFQAVDPCFRRGDIVGFALCNREFIEAVAEPLAREFGWDVQPKRSNVHTAARNPGGGAAVFRRL